MKIQLMITCLGDVVRPAAGQATVQLLRRLGHDVEFRPAQTCCGQPMFNSGYHDLARQQARQTIEVFAGDDPVVAPSGSCAAMVRNEFPHLLADDPAWHDRAKQLARRTYELAEFLVGQLGLVDVGARYAGCITYHYACHLRGLGQTDEAIQLIQHVRGATYVPMHNHDQCCGFGGSFAVRYGNISTAMVDDKMRWLAASGADTLVSTDTGCLMNLAGRLERLSRESPSQPRVRVLHLAELLASDGG